ncbi:hypothetical protein Nepgr_033647 [Nepenthes gracilis]|uniref:Transmembrane protein n=1 Tax=Nepenthes gracilis TaxID=150966 RepID=A0AAD3TL03_NEPGR|nr:hypothetical protein Nepgr_033647 [Nepenthes gracilis]
MFPTVNFCTVWWLVPLSFECDIVSLECPSYVMWWVKILAYLMAGIGLCVWTRMLSLYWMSPRGLAVRWSRQGLWDCERIRTGVTLALFPFWAGVVRLLSGSAARFLMVILGWRLLVARGFGIWRQFMVLLIVDDEAVSPMPYPGPVGFSFVLP